jgi:hypothetical protein
MNVFWGTLVARVLKSAKDYLSKPSTYWKARKYLEKQKQEEKRNEKIIDDINADRNA